MGIRTEITFRLVCSNRYDCCVKLLRPCKNQGASRLFQNETRYAKMSGVSLQFSNKGKDMMMKDGSIAGG